MADDIINFPQKVDKHVKKYGSQIEDVLSGATVKKMIFPKKAA